MRGTSPRRIAIIVVITSLVVGGLGAVFFTSTREVVVSGYQVWWMFSIAAFLTIAAAGGVIAAMNGFGRVVANSLQMAKNVTPNAGRFCWRIGFNALNTVFLPSYLNEDGLKARKRVIAGLGIMFAGLLTTAAALLAFRYGVPQ